MDLSHVLTVVEWPDLGASFANGLMLVEHTRASAVVGVMVDDVLCFLVGGERDRRWR